MKQHPPTSILDVKALLTFAMMLTTFPTLEHTDGESYVYYQHRSSPRASTQSEARPFVNVMLKAFSVPCPTGLPDGVFKVDVVHTGSDTGTACMSLSCERRDYTNI